MSAQPRVPQCQATGLPRLKLLIFVCLGSSNICTPYPPRQWKVHFPLALNILRQIACLPSSSVICVTKILNFEKNSVSLFASSRESHPVNQRFKQLCITEPVGGSAPKFSEKSSGFVLTEKSLHPFSLACPAQGSPTPAFRSALLWSLFRVTFG